MGLFICEKCGKIDNTACGNNYWLAVLNKNRIKHGEIINPLFRDDNAYFETHTCCSDCCESLVLRDNSGMIQKKSYDIENKKHWSEYGREKLLDWEKRNDGSMMNASEYFASIDAEQQKQEQPQA